MIDTAAETWSNLDTDDETEYKIISQDSSDKLLGIVDGCLTRVTIYRSESDVVEYLL